MTKAGHRQDFLIELLGNTTRVRILSYLVNNTTPITRHVLAKELGAGLGPVYSQVLAFRALGVVREEEGKISLDPGFPFIEELRDLVQRIGNYLQDLENVLDRIDALLGDDYYVTGYLAARQHGAAIDYDNDSILVAFIGKDKVGETTKLLSALSSATPIKMIWSCVKDIPKEITRRHIYGSEIWIASIERGILDSLSQHDFPISAVLALFLQNLLDGNINKERLKALAEERRLWGTVCLLIQAFNKGAKRVLIPLTAEERHLAQNTSDPELLENARNAMNSVLGG